MRLKFVATLSLSVLLFLLFIKTKQDSETHYKLSRTLVRIKKVPKDNFLSLHIYVRGKIPLDRNMQDQGRSGHFPDETECLPGFFKISGGT